MCPTIDRTLLVVRAVDSFQTCTSDEVVPNPDWVNSIARDRNYEIKTRLWFSAAGSQYALYRSTIHGLRLDGTKDNYAILTEIAELLKRMAAELHCTLDDRDYVLRINITQTGLPIDCPAYAFMTARWTPRLANIRFVCFVLVIYFQIKAAENIT